MIVIALAVAGCTAEGGETHPRADSSPSPSPTIVDGKPCPPAPEHLDLGENAGCASTTSGTFEPEASSQTFVVYALLNADGLPRKWHFRVTSENGDYVDQEMRAGSEASYPVVLGAEDADGGGLDEAFVKILTHSYHSGKTHEVAIFGVRNGHFFRVKADGEPLVFQVGGVSVFGEGAECRDVDADGRPEFLLLYIDGVDNEVQETVERVYRWKNRALTLVRRKEGHMAKTGYSDPLLWRYYSLRCFAFEPEFPFTRG